MYCCSKWDRVIGWVLGIICSLLVIVGIGSFVLALCGVIPTAEPGSVKPVPYVVKPMPPRIKVGR